VKEPENETATIDARFASRTFRVNAERKSAMAQLFRSRDSTARTSGHTAAITVAVYLCPSERHGRPMKGAPPSTRMTKA
jgi:hypothetical protein